MDAPTKKVKKGQRKNRKEMILEALKNGKMEAGRDCQKSLKSAERVCIIR